jgi:hypothetical protein
MTLQYGDRQPARPASHLRVVVRRAEARALPTVHGWLVAALASSLLWFGLAKLVLALARL